MGPARRTHPLVGAIVAVIPSLNPDTGRARGDNTVFAAVYTSDVLLNTALGLYQPGTWTAQDWAIDIVDKYVQAQATGAVFDRFLDPARPS